MTDRLVYGKAIQVFGVGSKTKYPARESWII
jgi:hypothetical protein